MQSWRTDCIEEVFLGGINEMCYEKTRGEDYERGARR